MVFIEISVSNLLSETAPQVRKTRRPQSLAGRIFPDVIMTQKTRL